MPVSRRSLLRKRCRPWATRGSAYPSAATEKSPVTRNSPAPSLRCEGNGMRGSEAASWPPSADGTRARPARQSITLERKAKSTDERKAAYVLNEHLLKAKGQGWKSEKISAGNSALAVMKILTSLIALGSSREQMRPRP